ncbi:carbonic anhydrase 2-like [Pseudomyrmex gracilis]|uniref:carbonic anhydrase 2-like n=1 Tax=Pseudomyrmex gracilis TaxID=219809 RepID=UPI000995A8F5|nr:carbonic anhydrase 2-like [Pseudomyrmex gracilis]XP_020280405.1 carbonic anhydrase 2-like [Pseudomyrmex gracilis]
MVLLFLLISLGLFLLPRFCLGHDFSYDGSHGPSHWGEDYHACIGKHQSPINIEEHNVKNVSLPPLKLIGIDSPCLSFLTNNGHTVMLKSNESVRPMLAGGPLGNGVYVFEQLHFHWGENDREGSEDLINNRSFPMEMHAVFYKEDYKSMNEALKHSDGLTVLAYLYEVGPLSHPTYEPIVEMLPDIETMGKEKMLEEPLLLGRLLVPDVASMQDYFTYNGSLTTPPCLEIVTWIDFKDRQQLSHQQLAAFRDLRTSDGNKLTHNFRPVQPLEDRIVLQNIDTNAVHQNDDASKNVIFHNHHFGDHSGQHNLRVPFSIIALGAFLAILLIAI